MKMWLDFAECLKDSPKFRSTLEDHEHSITELENHLEKLVKISTQVVDAGKHYSHAMGSLINSFDSLATLFYEDTFVSTALKKLNTVLGELQTFLIVFLEQTQKSITISLNHFIKEDIKKVRETKKVFDKISDDLDSACIRNSQLLKTCKASDAEEAENVLTATQSCFHHTALDYTYLINSLQSKRRFHILSQTVMFVNGHFTYHKQGYEALTKFETYQKQLSTQLEELQAEYLSDHKEMDERHTLVHTKNLEFENILNQSLPTKRNIIIMEGYLFKRASNAFKTWNRRWFVIQNNKLYYTRRSKSEGITEMVDLRLSTVKHAQDMDRRFTFSVVCPTKCWYLQADNECLKEKWMSVMQMAIARALNDPDQGGDFSSEDTLEKLHPQYLLTQIRDLSGNDTCADCSLPNPKWASINLGIVVCIECSGIHRSLGVHISKVRSITLDDWDPESIKLLVELGNDVVNNVYEAEVDASLKKPTPSSSRQEKEAWIQAKYVDKKFVTKVKSTNGNLKSRLKRGNIIKRGSDGRLRAYTIDKINVLEGSPKNERRVDDSPKVDRSASLKELLHNTSSGDSFCTGTDSEDDHDVTSLHPNMLLYQASRSKNISMMLLAVANGADVNWRNYESEERTALHETVISGSVTASEFLLQNAAQVNITDKQGRSGLHYAAMHGSTGHTCLFLKRDADQKALDKNEQDPLMIALKNENADIVTLLRLARLHEEIKETDITMGGDETVTNVFRDFSNMASQQPERLTRDRHTNV
ncbi:arf-GAP with coiled-coil, ANK repeat and PH domain-containing protein 2-like [Hydractinia symbiolongicarpus]|uniref:arf-GAP with coiled-coil, ANK repeat and PH domain-containing protein 2-like n=1 Tax=Hydractinia symbiolongicarpus TaxID=13093 RepID=UPI002551BCFF|nr:arf-GAP with coiled-coil, ANK repeat and PH domain-containing protein 2-like [Hydractinia symbiolongicarpus]